MRFRGKILLLLFFFMLASRTEAQQPKEMFKQKRERKRVWRRHRSSKDAYNPYLKKKNKDKPSQKIATGNKREIRQQKRRDKRQIRRSKKLIKKHSTVR
jgi:hypothetical protein